MQIPLPKIMRHWRNQEFERGISPKPFRWGIRSWAWSVRRPWLYRLGARVGAGAMAMLGRRKGRLSKLPLAGGWTDWRDMPAPEGRTFHQLYAARRNGKAA